MAMLNYQRVMSCDTLWHKACERPCFPGLRPHSVHFGRRVVHGWGGEKGKASRRASERPLDSAISVRIFTIMILMAVCQNLVPLVNINIAGKWMFIPLKMVLIGIDPYPYKIYMLWKKLPHMPNVSTCQLCINKFWWNHDPETMMMSEVSGLSICHGLWPLVQAFLTRRGGYQLGAFTYASVKCRPQSPKSLRGVEMGWVETAGLPRVCRLTNSIKGRRSRDVKSKHCKAWIAGEHG